ncbi:S41 family peptidase [Erythrobacter sp. JK5]|uniref:S41 family peptidase n=1 Tax=Erythrobacter sp. JK5 TaxID=2829500 RepID=UPI001BA90DD0|nr:S41 family peptidase [Erythrobacter sp. JK5]QUL37902.1 peptidase S41 [Erythrobacter sp. JK5]
MKIGRTALSATLALALVACGGGGSNPPPTQGGSTPTPTPPSSGCSVADQINFAGAVLDEWYLFPNLLDNTVNPASFNDVQAYLDARVAPARAQSRDRGFTFATSIQEENDLINSGSSAGFGIRLGYDTVNNRVFVLEAYENANGFAAGMDRGTELLAIGTTSANLQSVTSLMASGGPQAVVDALGPSTAGTARVIRFAQVGGTIVETTVTKSDFSLDPISDRYGALILNDGGKQVGYLNLRTFIVSDASNQLRDAFQLFGSRGVTELIIDFRYNGGGLVSVADTLGDLMGRGRVGQVWSETVLRASKSSENSTELFQNEVNALAPTKIAFIGRGGTASASELVINSMIPYLGNNMALIGANTFGKPVGQFGFDLDACDLRVRAVTFQTLNADGNGEYFTGLASEVANTCRANDDIFTPFGDPAEASIKGALDFLAGRACAAPITGAAGQTAQSVGGRELLQPERPNAAQYEIPGLF